MKSIEKQREEYRKYIYNHIKNVNLAWDRMKNNNACVEVLKNYFAYYELAIIECNDLIAQHDASKFGMEEFEPYRKHYYPVSSEEKNNSINEFNRAWEHHYTNNLHHWNWWYENNMMNSMPLQYVIEMICDWEAMGYVFGNTSLEWYEKNKNKIKLGSKQRALAEDLMHAIND